MMELSLLLLTPGGLDEDGDTVLLGGVVEDEEEEDDGFEGEDEDEEGEGGGGDGRSMPILGLPVTATLTLLANAGTGPYRLLLLKSTDARNLNPVKESGMVPVRSLSLRSSVWR
jgi:hypothetical protein